MSGSEAQAIEAAATAALKAAEAALANGTTADISDLAVQQLLTAGTRLFAAKTEQEARFFSPFTDATVVTATDVAITVTDLLRAVGLNTFDLSMWSNRPRPDAN